MLKNWGAWLGKENGQVGEERKSGLEEKNKDKKPTNVGENEQRTEQIPPQVEQKSKSFSGYISNFASNASKKLSESVIGTAETLKKSVEEGKLSEIIEKTILGDFQREQERFLKEKNNQKYGAAVPPWVGYSEEDTIQEQILALSADKRNFSRDPPAGVQFHFDFGQMYPVAMVMLEEDELLRKMRFHLVPKQVREEIFWRNYFYRVSLIKQSAQLRALAVQQASKAEDSHQNDAVKRQSFPAAYSPKSNEINDDDLHKGVDQLVLSKNKHPHSQQEETPDWERELQEELEEYDVLLDNESHDENWDREIEEMLKDDS
ncbi:synapse-associated protein 1-like [Cololabis saira]|uniref:synapse-associated protein 1-like n=1 Tax=Cololabis saira TaxID=129043 RepID=UPI002AD30663|nr:synapse-associated protein 1-like [Cololabis saira]